MANKIKKVNSAISSHVKGIVLGAVHFKKGNSFGSSYYAIRSKDYDNKGNVKGDSVFLGTARKIWYLGTSGVDKYSSDDLKAWGFSKKEFNEVAKKIKAAKKKLD